MEVEAWSHKLQKWVWCCFVVAGKEEKICYERLHLIKNEPILSWQKVTGSYFLLFAIFLAETLRDESPAYVSLIEARDDLSSMTMWQRAVLCASLLSSPIYRAERLEYSSKRSLNPTSDFVYSEEPLSFSYHNEKGKKSLILDCFICKGFANGDDIKSKSTNLYITRSYDDQSSVYLLKSNVESVYLDKYFKKISVLTIAKNLFKNYSERTSLEFHYDD